MVFTKSFTRSLICLVASVGFASVAEAATRTVPTGAYPTIQSAVDAAVSGVDDILVNPGTYSESVMIVDKDLIITSSGGQGATSVTSLSWTNPSSVSSGGRLEGFTITAGIAASGLSEDFAIDACLVQGASSIFNSFPQSDIFRGAIRITNSTFEDDLDVDQTNSLSIAKVSNCRFDNARLSVSSEFDATLTTSVFSNGSAVIFGETIDVSDNRVTGGVIHVRIDSQGGTVQGNVLVGAGSGTGLAVEFTSNAAGAVLNNEVSNYATGIDFSTSSNGGQSDVNQNCVRDCAKGIVISTDADIGIRGNTVSGCSTTGIETDSSDNTVTLENNLVVGNGIGVDLDLDSSSSVLTCNDVWDNPSGNWIGVSNPTGTDGNISTDPLFCDVGDPCTLESGSPCLPGQHPDGVACGLIGARGMGVCEPTAVVTNSSWGDIKRLFR